MLLVITPPAFIAHPIPTREAISSTLIPLELYPKLMVVESLVPLMVNSGILILGVPLFLFMVASPYFVMAAAFGAGGKKSTNFSNVGFDWPAPAYVNNNIDIKMTTPNFIPYLI
jgi:hypothetical protein